MGSQSSHTEARDQNLSIWPAPSVRWGQKSHKTLQDFWSEMLKSTSWWQHGSTHSGKRRPLRQSKQYGVLEMQLWFLRISCQLAQWSTKGKLRMARSYRMPMPWQRAVHRPQGEQHSFPQEYRSVQSSHCSESCLLDRVCKTTIFKQWSVLLWSKPNNQPEHT